MINRMKKTLLYAGLEKDEYNSLKNKMIRMNQESLKSLNIITAGIMLILIALSYQSRNWTADRIYYCICLCFATGILIFMHFWKMKSEITTLILVYTYLGMIFLYGIAIGSTQPSMTSVSFLIFIMVGPLLLYDSPIRINIFIWIFNIFFILNSIENKEPLARDTDIVNSIFYGIISSFVNTNAIIFKMRRVWLEKRVRDLAETDILTGLRNRNSFNEHYLDYAKDARRNVTCIYLDANGLHEINNSKGHDAGDEMLKYLAEQTVLLFGREDAYRIGGDEYLVICCDKDVENIRQQANELSERLKEKNYSVSIGITNASVSELNMDELIKKADEEMYNAKRKHYEQNSIDRRKKLGLGFE